MAGWTISGIGDKTGRGLWREYLARLDCLAMRLSGREPIAEVGRDVVIDVPELLLGQGYTVPSFQRVLRQVVGGRGVASVKEPVGPDLANALYEEVGFVLPRARYGYPTDIEVYIFHSRIFSLDCFHKYRKSGVGCRVVVASTPRKMRDLYDHIRSLRE